MPFFQIYNYSQARKSYITRQNKSRKNRVNTTTCVIALTGQNRRGFAIRCKNDEGADGGALVRNDVDVAAPARRTGGRMANHGLFIPKHLHMTAHDRRGCETRLVGAP